MLYNFCASHGVPHKKLGKLVVVGLNYSASLAKIVSNPVPFNGDGPDIVVNAGLVVADSWSSFTPYNGRVRHKYGLDLLYTALPYLGFGVRGDRVVPSSKDSAETFHVIAPRLVFRSGWNSRESITLLYAKWFYGSHSHPEASAISPIAPGDRLGGTIASCLAAVARGASMLRVHDVFAVRQALTIHRAIEVVHA